MRKKTIPMPDYVTVTSLRTIDWNWNDSTQFVEGQQYTIPASLYQSLQKYFTISNENQAIEENNDASN
jgi:hypothetical protein